jgi:hypothetical protein
MKPNSRFQRAIATFFLLIFFPTLIPQSLYAANNGPNAPEAASFEPVDATDMVSLATGDMAYVLPLLNVPSPEGGYPISLAYHGGIGYDQEASWVGLGWNLNPGSINRSVNGVPDDWNNAEIRDKEHFEAWGKSADLSVGYGRVEASLGYSWDSNGTKRGSVSIGYGFKSGNTNIGVGVGASYSNTSGWAGSITGGIQTQNGFGVGVYADTDGLMGISAGHSTNFGIPTKTGNVKTSSSTVGFSLTSNKGSVGVSLSGGGNSILNSQSGNTSSSSIGYSAGIYLYGFVIKLGYSESTYSRSKLDYDHVFGPLYYSKLSDAPAGATGSALSYPGSLPNEHNRDYYMDAYNQPIPESMQDAVAYNSVFDAQKNAFNAPAYDFYDVNAQGLAGRMSPRLLDNGLIINPGFDIEYAEEQHGMTCAYNVCGERNGIYSPLACTALSPAMEQLGTNIINRRIYSNSHYSNDPNHKFKNTFGRSDSKINFYFDYQFPSDLKVTPSTLNQFNNSNTIENYFNSVNSTITTRKENSDYIETFTNSQITSGVVTGQFLEAKGYNRSQDEGYRPDGIGGYRITTADGKTYHYSRPVYQFEQIYRHLAPKYEGNGSTAPNSYPESDGFYREIRKKEPYATHWMLTAITGPDYVKMGNNPYPDEGDYGYWVRFDYGNWSDGYVWRTPYNGYDRLNKNSAIASDEYSWGRKQLVYLDKVVTRTHTALFVKSLREDDLGKNLGEGGYPSNESDNNVNYLRQRTLKLDEIILLKNTDYNNSVQASTQVANLTTEPTNNVANWSSMSPISYKLNQQLNVIDKGDFIINPQNGKYYIYDKAQKIVKLNQSYELAKNSPNSTAATKGRLTLDGVSVLDKMGELLMPSYAFDYIGKEVNYTNGSDKDQWGYKENNPSLWTMNKITTPTGGKILLNYEEDQYYTEAFSRRMFDEDDLKFRLYIDEHGSPLVEFQQNSYYGGERIDFTKYFEKNEETYGSVHCCHSEPDTAFEHGDRDWVGVDGNLPMRAKHVDPNYVVLYLPQFTSDTFDQVTGYDFREKGGWRCYVGSGCRDDDNHSAWVFNFKLMANKVPSGQGGGIRVSKISTVDELGKSLATEYNYNDPVKNRTSGITSYAPSTKYVAYRAEVPGPRVMYEYVTLTEKGTYNDVSGKTQYQFSVLKPVLNVFDPNMRSGEHFRSTASVNTLDGPKKTYGVNVKLEDNFGTIGGLVSVSQINQYGHVISQLKNDYLDLNKLSDNTTEKPGALQESFHSIKSIYDYNKEWLSGMANLGILTWQEKCEGNENIYLNKRLAFSSTKIKYPLVQNKKIETRAGNQTITEFKNIDPKTGLYLESYTTFANGTAIKTKSIPAYVKYPEMGSKVVNPANKHMLTQNTAEYSYILDNGVWKETGVGITTWNNQWTYEDISGSLVTPTQSNEKVWRKHMTYIWNGVKDTQGIFQNFNSATDDGFNWSLGVGSQSVKWKKISEVTKYNHYSSILETKDINNNHMATKMGDDEAKIMAVGNAKYNELFYSGIENLTSNDWLEPCIRLTGAVRNMRMAHTGRYSVETTNTNTMTIDLKNGQHKSGKYKLNVWIQKDNVAKADIVCTYGTVTAGEIKQAGDWVLKTYYLDLPVAATQVKLASLDGSAVIYDDVMLRPIASGVTGYVYNQRDELSHIVGNNGLATRFEYDGAGRLVKTYVEVFDDPANMLTGGFKLTKENKLKYKNF